MIANYHTHTPRCKHAQGSEEAYVRCAIEAGIQTLGFSDHTPYPFPNGYVSTFRMAVEELPGYANAVRTVQAQFSGQIGIRLGVEAEFYPKYFADMLNYPVISNCGTYVMEHSLFYDSIWHCTLTGAAMRTENLLADLKRYLDNPNNY